MSEKNLKPLSGIRVLDIGTNIAGPLGATILGEFGAEIIKVEMPGIGDPMRHMAPVYNDTSFMWAVIGRNKKSITLDLRQEKGQELLRKLVAVSDVVIENFRPGTMEKWNLGYEELKKVNPEIIFTRVSAFGQTGPYKNRGGYDRVGLAMGGIMHLTGYPDSPPVRVGVNITDQVTGLFNLIGTLIALYHRDRNRGGSGQMIDVTLTESMIRLLEGVLSEYDKLGTIREREGNGNPLAAPAENFLSSDGRWFTFAVTSDSLFERFAKVTGLEELANNPDYRNNLNRVKNKDKLHAVIRIWFSQKTTEEISSCLEVGGIPFGIIYDARDIIEDPQNIARGNILKVEDPNMGPVKMPGVTPRLSLTPGIVEKGAPNLGEHNQEVYRDLLGINENEMNELRESGII